MKNQMLTDILPLKAGDIVVSQARSGRSWFIRIATLSCWSHVGIAVGDGLILEAVGGEGVRRTKVSDFVQQNSLVRRYVRPQPLNDTQLKRLESFGGLALGTSYTAIHAGLTSTVPLWRLFCCVIALVSTCKFLLTGLSAANFSIANVWAVLTVNATIFFVYWMQVFAFRCDWGVKATERIFRQCGLGSKLVDIKYDMFCSKLVLLADRGIDGPLSALVLNSQEIQPKHVARSCERLGWKS